MGVEIRLYRVIYELLGDLEKALAGLLGGVAVYSQRSVRRMLERVLPRVTVLSSAELLPTARLNNFEK